MTNYSAYIELLTREITPATGCTEPAAVALAAAAAAQILPGGMPVRVEAFVSEDIFRNGVNVIIPSSGGLRGLGIAAAIGAVRSTPELGLRILSGLSREDIRLVERIQTEVRPIETADKVYARVCVYGGGHIAEATVRGYHDCVTERRLDGGAAENCVSPTLPTEDSFRTVSISDVVQFAREVEPGALEALRGLVDMNWAIAQEGVSGEYGIGVGRCMINQMEKGMLSADLKNEAVAVTAAAVDARMAGCDMPVMSVAGSGNQGLTVSLPVIVAARRLGCGDDIMLRALAMGALISIHTKGYVGRLSALCGCGISAALGTCAALTYLFGGTDQQINQAINTMIAGISGMVCDGAKPGCALKVATSVSAAYQAALLVISGSGASEHDGIVCADAEHSLSNLGRLGNEAMASANRVILGLLDKNNNGGNIDE